MSQDRGAKDQPQGSHRQPPTAPLDTPLDTPPLQDPFLGMVLAGKYRLTKHIASGGMGEVYLAQHTKLDARRAVKLVKSQHLNDPLARKRFLREIKTTHAICLASEHIVTIYDDYDCSDGLGYYVMEFLEGEPLTAHIDRQPGRLSWTWVREIAAQLCAGMEVVHSHEVLHRDLKPDNIFICHKQGRPQVKLLDFGIALKAQGGTPLTHQDVFIGTLPYMSPEQIEGPQDGQTGNEHLGPSADIYAIGCVLFEMLAGHPPFPLRDSSPSAYTKVINAHLRKTPPCLHTIRPELPKALAALVSQALAKAPAARFASVKELAEAIKALPDEANAAKQTKAPKQANATPASHRALPTPSPARSQPDPLIDTGRWDRNKSSQVGLRRLGSISLFTAGLITILWTQPWLLRGKERANTPTHKTQPTPTRRPTQARTSTTPDSAPQARPKKHQPAQSKRPSVATRPLGSQRRRTTQTRRPRLRRRRRLYKPPMRLRLLPKERDKPKTPPTKKPSTREVMILPKDYIRTHHLSLRGGSVTPLGMLRLPAYLTTQTIQVTVTVHPSQSPDPLAYQVCVFGLRPSTTKLTLKPLIKRLAGLVNRDYCVISQHPKKAK